MADPNQEQEQEQAPQVPRFICPYNFGLTLDDGSSVPLQDVSVDISILDFLAEVTLEQRFKNAADAKDSIEAVYRFPLDAEAVLKGFSVELEDGTVVKGQVQEKQRAADTYDDALAGGHGGFLLQEDNEMKDVFSLRVGNLPPGAAATVRMTYVAQIDEEAPEEAGGNSTLRFVLPTAVAPRYSPRGDLPPEIYQHAEALLAKWPKDLLKITGRVTAATPILGLAPHTFKEETSLEVGGGNTASFALTAGHLDEDFVLTVHLQGSLPDRCWVDRTTGAATVAAGLRPGQLAAAGINAAPADEDEEAEGAAQGEFVFVIDRSGSMAGASILQAREALALCVSALPLGARFQVVGFGNDFMELFPDGPRAFDDASKAAALAHCHGLDADMGGTEILAPLKALGAKPAKGGIPRQVFVITDGQVCNTAGVLAFVREDHRRAGTRYFALGIGAGASRALVKGIAEQGGGASAFVVEGERLQRKVMAQMNRALELGLTDVKVGVRPPLRLLAKGGGEGEGFAPKKPRPLFTGARLLYYGHVDPASLAGIGEGGEGLVVVSGQGGHGARKKEVALPVPLRFVGTEAEGRMLQALATRAALRDLEEEEAGAAAEEEGKEKAAALKARAVALSEKSGVLCKWTSYVAVAERRDAATGALKPVHLPLAFVNRANQGDPWSYVQRQHTGAFAGGACAPAMMSFAACSPPPPPGHGARMAPMMAMACATPMAPMAPAPMARHPLAKRGVMHRMLGRTAKVMDTTAEAADAAAAMSMADVDINNSFGSPLPGPGANNAGGVDHVAIVARQRAGGDWEWDEAFLAAALGVEAGKLRAAVDVQLAPLGAWATALLLAKLERDFAAFAEEWEAAARKARRWLGKQLAAGARAVDAAALVERAGEVLAAAA